MLVLEVDDLPEEAFPVADSASELDASTTSDAAADAAMAVGAVVGVVAGAKLTVVQ